ncbi:hypothetical protein F5J12DRAFT_905738 [Pisolithus orientalis]|uniref:uncharacterized protein n=1 Tax=Pisolithus orientalis TaxID=936130 RepID=UPI002223F3AB|nr:uncharacterized protein F5J12DRAFT_905738 [Pisolithus orientalis]KAI6006263.1 hypothetical protein F5J12DRAFT_905738 [Pisolithus orientalis]
MNHFLHPLVNELLQFWDPSCYFSHTATCPAGCLVHYVLIPLICDVPALRKVASFMGHSGHSFCSFCCLQDSDITNFDEHVRLATMWWDAPTENLDIMKYTILDAMHNLFLGDLKRHLVNIWRMTSTAGKTPKGMIDMNQTMLPSWMAQAPCNLGSPNQGYVKADQWQTACEVNLVIMFVWLWGRLGSKQAHRAYLANFLALVMAVHWATKQSTSELHMKLYLHSLVRLFPLSVLKPNHHLSLHLVECMRLFGPTHGWWAFPFEPYNGILGSANTNGKEGV